MSGCGRTSWLAGPTSAATIWTGKSCLIYRYSILCPSAFISLTYFLVCLFYNLPDIYLLGVGLLHLPLYRMPPTMNPAGPPSDLPTLGVPSLWPAHIMCLGPHTSGLPRHIRSPPPPHAYEGGPTSGKPIVFLANRQPQQHMILAQGRTHWACLELVRLPHHLKAAYLLRLVNYIRLS